jgi:hypothetical protein
MGQAGISAIGPEDHWIQDRQGGDSLQEVGSQDQIGAIFENLFDSSESFEAQVWYDKTAWILVFDFDELPYFSMPVHQCTTQTIYCLKFRVQPQSLYSCSTAPSPLTGLWREHKSGQSRLMTFSGVK